MVRSHLDGSPPDDASPPRLGPRPLPPPPPSAAGSARAPGAVIPFPRPPEHDAAPLSAPLLPTLRPRDAIDPDLDRALSAAAMLAQRGDVLARDALYAAFAPKIERFVRRAASRAAAGEPRDRERHWEPADLAQEAYFLFVALIDEWDGDSFTAFVFSRLPWRLHNTARAWTMTGPPVTGDDAAVPLGELADASAEGAEALVLLEALAARLPRPDDAELLLWRVRDGLSFHAIARRQSVERRTLNRRWRRLQGELRATLDGGAR